MNSDSYSWTSGESRYKPRLSVLSRMTNLQHEVDDRALTPDLVTISNVAFDFAGRDWELFLAHKEIPAWKEDEAKHSSEEVARINRSALSVTDGVIAHAYQGGSIALGWLLQSAAASCRCIPILIVCHVDQPLSKALEGLARAYRNVTVVRFNNDFDLSPIITGWLTENREAIEEGPLLRQDIDLQWGPMADQIIDALAKATDETRRALRRMIPDTGRGLEELLELVTPLADMSATVMARIMGGLQINMARQRVLELARDYLDANELHAWWSWSRARPQDFAWQVLSAAVEDRRTPIVARQPFHFGTPESWTVFAQRWSNRADS